MLIVIMAEMGHFTSYEAGFVFMKVTSKMVKKWYKSFLYVTL